MNPLNERYRTTGKKLRKKYTAIVEGVPKEKSGRIASNLL